MLFVNNSFNVINMNMNFPISTSDGVSVISYMLTPFMDLVPMQGSLCRKEDHRLIFLFNDWLLVALVFFFFTYYAKWHTQGCTMQQLSTGVIKGITVDVTKTSRVQWNVDYLAWRLQSPQYMHHIVRNNTYELNVDTYCCKQYDN